MADLDPSILSGSDSGADPVADNADAALATAPAAPASVPSQPGPVISAPDVSQPMSPDVISGVTGGAQSGPDYGAAGASVPTPAGQPSVWKNLVMGAIAGLAGSAGAKTFGGGAAGGAAGALEKEQADKEFALKSQKQASDIQFQSVQAAHMAAQATLLAKQVANYDEDHQAEVFARNTDVAKNISALTGVNPEYATQNDSESEMAAMRDATRKNGGVPPYLSIQVGKDAFLHFNMQQMTQSGSALQVINEHNRALGRPEMTPQQYEKMTPEQQIQQTANAATAWGPTSSQDQLNSMKNDLALIKAKPADFYKRAQSIDTLQKAISTSEELVSKSQATANAQAQAGEQAKAAGKVAGETSPEAIKGEATKAGAVAGAEAKAKQGVDSKPVYAIDKDGNTVMTTGAAATASGMTGIRAVKQGDIEKDQHDIKVLNDIQVKSDAVQKAASALDTAGPGQFAIAAKLLADNPNTTADQLIRSDAMKHAAPAVKDYVISVLSLRESSMGLQKVLTGSARSNEAQINALQNTLPGIEPDSGTVGKKIAAFNQNLGMLSEGLPSGTGVQMLVRRGGQQQQAAAPPKGATMKVPGSDGKLHWSDGKQDLGVAQ